MNGRGEQVFVFVHASLLFRTELQPAQGLIPLNPLNPLAHESCGSRAQPTLTSRAKLASARNLASRGGATGSLRHWAYCLLVRTREQTKNGHELRARSNMSRNLVASTPQGLEAQRRRRPLLRHVPSGAAPPLAMRRRRPPQSRRARLRRPPLWGAARCKPGGWLGAASNDLGNAPTTRGPRKDAHIVGGLEPRLHSLGVAG